MTTGKADTECFETQIHTPGSIMFLVSIYNKCQNWPIRKEWAFLAEALKRQALKQSVQTEGDRGATVMRQYEKNNVNTQNKYMNLKMSLIWDL